MPSIFGDHMVVQRDTPLPIWGKAEPGQAVNVKLEGGDITRSADAAADDRGRWRVDLKPVNAAGPYTLTVTAEGSEKLTFDDVLAGEVWLCGGQSNMEWSMSVTNNAPEEIAAADFPQMRIFNARHTPAGAPAEDVQGEWQVVTPQTIPGFSAVGYFFGRRIHQETGAPVGLIGSNWGGTPVMAWMPPQAIEAAGHEAELKNAQEYIARRPTLGVETLVDTGIIKPHWAQPGQNMAGWGKLPVPGPFLMNGVDFNGAVWFVRTFNVPEAVADQAMTLRLGPIDDDDVTFINGRQVGGTKGWNADRTYEVPAGVLKAGENTIAVRVFDAAAGGGFKGRPEQLVLEPVEGEPIALAGEWNVGVERISVRDPDANTGPAAQNVPTALHNGMIAPLTPYALRGFLWYQGESDASRGRDYAPLLREMIASWRQEFEGPDERPQPFLIVQLANFQQRSDDPVVNDDWARLREAQRMVAEDEGNGLAVTIDIGDAGDIHPRNKQDVGKRLALVAMKDVYDKEVQAHGPTATAARLRDGRVVVEFEHAESLEFRGDATGAFAVGDAAGNFVWATPKFDGETVVLSFEGIEEPTMVRYAWQINPPAPLYNAAGLPGVPFELKME